MEETGTTGVLIGGFIWLVFVLGMMALMLVIWWQIFKKAGHHPALSLLMLVPFANIVMLFVLAFGKWPIYEKLSQSAINKEE